MPVGAVRELEHPGGGVAGGAADPRPAAGGVGVGHAAAGPEAELGPVAVEQAAGAPAGAGRSRQAGLDFFTQAQGLGERHIPAPRGERTGRRGGAGGALAQPASSRVEPRMAKIFFMCSLWDSNPHCDDFKSSASAIGLKGRKAKGPRLL